MLIAVLELQEALHQLDQMDRVREVVLITVIAFFVIRYVLLVVQLEVAKVVVLVMEVTAEAVAVMLQ